MIVPRLLLILGIKPGGKPEAIFQGADVDAAAFEKTLQRVAGDTKYETVITYYYPAPSQVFHPAHNAKIQADNLARAKAESEKAAADALKSAEANLAALKPKK